MRKKIKFISYILIFSLILNCLQIHANETDLNFNGKSIYVMEYETETCLYEKNAYEHSPMASTTKIMTAIIILEADILQKITSVSKNAASTEGSSMNLKEGEEISVNDLLYGLLIKSGNDAAVALAEALSGDVETFCNLMNEKAYEIGAYDTNFTSPHGLDDENHYSTAKDLAIIAKYALKNQKFRNIVSTKNTSVNGHYLSNTNDLLWSFDEIKGVKTGYTGKAGRCIVLFIEKNDLQLIAVIMGCRTSEERTSDGKMILDYFPGNYSVKNIIEAGAVIDTLKCVKCSEKYVSLITKDRITLCLSVGEFDNLKFKKILYEQYENGIKSDINAGTVVGIYYVYLGEKLIETTEIIVTESVKSKDFLDFISDFFFLFVKKTFATLYRE